MTNAPKMKRHRLADLGVLTSMRASQLRRLPTPKFIAGLRPSVVLPTQDLILGVSRHRQEQSGGCGGGAVRIGALAVVGRQR
jgi:hypothetical protein